MGEYYNIVPWYNNKEWLQLYNDVFSPTSTLTTKGEALNILVIWKSRAPSLPSGIESTLSLLEVYVQDAKHNDSMNDQIIRLAYSTAIMRFVNHMLDSITAKGTSLYKAAISLGVPDWIIDLRHDAAHGSSLPTIDLLREAAIIGLDWLKCNYWDKHKEFVGDYVCGQINVDESDGNKMSALMNVFVSLSICAHTKLNIKNLGDIPDLNMRECIITNVQDVFEEGFDFSNLKKVSIKSLINFITTNSKNLLKSKNSSAHVNKALLGKESLFLSMELLHFLSGNKLRKSTELNKQYTYCFEVLLKFLHTHDLLQNFILELIKITQCSKETNQKRWLAAVWISEILKALRKSSQFVQMMKLKNLLDLQKKKRKDLLSLYQHWFPNEKGCLLLDLFTPVPKDLTDINFVRPIISSYNEFLTYFISDILNLIEPPLPSVIKEKICKLAKLISASTKSNMKPIQTKIYTVRDLKDASDDVIAIDVDETFMLQEDIKNNAMAHSNTSHEEKSYGVWHLDSHDYDWSKCPIGTLPWNQDNYMKVTEINDYDAQNEDCN